MTIKINRFESKIMEEQITYKTRSKKTVAIKDHQTDKYVVLVNLDESPTKNKELAERIITTVEEFILEND